MNEHFQNFISRGTYISKNSISLGTLNTMFQYLSSHDVASIYCRKEWSNNNILWVHINYICYYMNYNISSYLNEVKSRWI